MDMSRDIPSIGPGQGTQDPGVIGRGPAARKTAVNPSDLDRVRTGIEIGEIDGRIAPLESYVEREANRGMIGRDAFARNDAKMRLVAHYYEKARKILALTGDPGSEAFLSEVDKIVSTADEIIHDYYRYPESQYLKAEALILAGRYEDAINTSKDLLENLESLRFRNRLNIPFWRVNGYKSRAYVLLGRALSLQDKHGPDPNYPEEDAYLLALKTMRGILFHNSITSFDPQFNAESRVGLGEVELAKCRQEYNEDGARRATGLFLEALSSGGSKRSRLSSVEQLLGSVRENTFEISPSKPGTPIISRELVTSFFGNDGSWKQFFYDGSFSQSLSEWKFGSAVRGIFSSPDLLEEEVLEFRSNAKELINSSGLDDDKKEFLLTALDANAPVFVRRENITKLFDGLGENKEDWRQFFDNPEATVLKFRHNAGELISAGALPENIRSALRKIISDRGDNFRINFIQHQAINNAVEEDLLIRAVVNTADALVLRGTASEYNSGREMMEQAGQLLDFVLTYPFIENKVLLYSNTLSKRVALELSLAACCAQNGGDNLEKLSGHIRDAFVLNSYLEDYAEASFPKGTESYTRMIAEIYENYANILSLYHRMPKDDRGPLSQHGIGPSFTYEAFRSLLGRQEYRQMCDRAGVAEEITGGMGLLLNENVYLLTAPVNEESLGELGLGDERKAAVLEVLNKAAGRFPEDMAANMENIIKECSRLLAPMEAARADSHPGHFNFNRALIADLKTAMIRDGVLASADATIEQVLQAYGELVSVSNDKDAISVFDDPKHNNPWLRANNYLALANCLARMASFDKEISQETRRKLSSALGIDIDTSAAAPLTKQEKSAILSKAIEEYAKPALACAPSYYGSPAADWNKTLETAAGSERPAEWKEKAQKNINIIFALTMIETSRLYLDLCRASDNADDLSAAKGLLPPVLSREGIDGKIHNLAIIGYADCAAREAYSVVAAGNEDWGVRALEIINKSFDVNSKTGEVLVLVEETGQKLPLDNSVDSLGARLAIANILLSQAKASTEDKEKAEMVISTTMKLCEESLLAKPEMPQAIKDRILVHYADAVSLKINLAVANKGEGKQIEEKEALSNIVLSDSGKPVEPIAIRVSGIDTPFEVTDNIMAQKIKLAIINVWTTNVNREHYDTVARWANDILDNPASAFIRRVAQSFRNVK